MTSEFGLITTIETNNNIRNHQTMQSHMNSMNFGQNGEKNYAPQTKLHIDQCNIFLKVEKDNGSFP